MSCWIVEKGHIDCLVQALVNEGQCPIANASMVGRTLWRQNVYSHQARYPQAGDERAGAMGDIRHYKFRGNEAPLDPAIVLQQVHCYQYQSSDHPHWRDSPAFALMAQLEDTLVNRGIDPAGPWGISDIDQAVAKGRTP